MRLLTQLLTGLLDGGVAFVVVGGAAATAHGSAIPTFDLDICYARDRANLERLARTVAAWHPKLRGAPPDIPFLWDAETLRRGLNFTLATDLGPLDLLGEVAGVGGYEHARPRAAEVRVFGVSCAVLSLHDLIAAKRAAGRTKDLAALPELEALLEAQQDD
jgi:predicted nucleotidyltransferase